MCWNPRRHTRLPMINELIFEIDSTFIFANKRDVINCKNVAKLTGQLML